MDDRKGMLLLLSRMLDYPEEEHLDVNEYVSSETMQQEALGRMNPLFEMSLKDLQELYIQTFDYKDETNLYLTAHELGDSRKRGFALIQLQKLVSDLGYEYIGKELVDYIPMLLELLAVAPEEEKYDNLSRRLAYVINRILANLPSYNPYKKVMELLMMYVFEAPSDEEISSLEKLREVADLDELPYPLMYQ